MSFKKIVTVLIIAIASTGAAFAVDSDISINTQIVQFLTENGVDIETLDGLDALIVDDELRAELNMLVHRALAWHVRGDGDTATMQIGDYDWSLHNPLPE